MHSYNSCGENDGLFIEIQICGDGRRMGEDLCIRVCQCGVREDAPSIGNDRYLRQFKLDCASDNPRCARQDSKRHAVIIGVKQAVKL